MSIKVRNENKEFVNILTKEEMENVQRTTLNTSNSNLSIEIEVMKSNQTVTINGKITSNNDYTGLLSSLDLEFPEWCKPITKPTSTKVLANVMSIGSTKTVSFTDNAGNNCTGTLLTNFVKAELWFTANGNMKLAGTFSRNTATEGTTETTNFTLVYIVD